LRNHHKRDRRAEARPDALGRRAWYPYLRRPRQSRAPDAPRGSVRTRATAAFWRVTTPAGRVTPLLTRADGNAMLGLQFGGCDGAAGAHGSGISPVPLPRVRWAIQRAQRRPAEPDAVSERRHRAMVLWRLR